MPRTTVQCWTGLPDANFSIGSEYPVLSAYMLSRDPVSIIKGPLGSGKTIGTVQRIMMHMTEQPPNPAGERPTRFLAIRSTYSELLETTVKDFLALFEPLGRMRYGSMEPPNWKGKFNLIDGTHVNSEVIFLALDRPDDIKKIKGYQVSAVWVNEVSETSKAIVDMADLRHGRYPSMISGGVRCGFHGIFGDTNSYHNTHWLFEIFEKRRPIGWTLYTQPGGVLDTGKVDEMGEKIWRLNPDAENLQHLPVGYYQRGMSGKDSGWISVMLANNYGFLQKGAPVHPRYIDSIHCVNEEIVPLERYPLILGVDYGRTPAATIGQYWAHIDLHVTIDEMVSFDMSAAIFAPELKRKLDREYPGFAVQAWGDPSGDSDSQATEDSPTRIMRAAGIPCKAANTNVAALRRAALDNPLTRMRMGGGPAYRLSGPKCPHLRQALAGGYHYRELQIAGPDRRYSPTPEKNDSSHICFAPGTLIATPGGSVPVEDLRPGDSVSTPLGPCPVTHAWERQADRVKLRFDDGTTLVCTPDHPFVGANGYMIEAEALRYGDPILTRESPLWIQRSCLRSAQARNTPYTSSTATASAIPAALAATTRVVVGAFRFAISTTMYGRLRMERFWTTARSITSTANRAITDSRIYSAWIGPNTGALIFASATAQTGPRNDSAGSRFAATFAGGVTKRKRLESRIETSAPINVQLQIASPMPPRGEIRSWFLPSIRMRFIQSMNSMAFAITRNLRAGTTSPAPPTGRGIFIAWSGLRRMVPYPKVSTSTTKMAARVITLWQTWNWWKLQPIIGRTCSSLSAWQCLGSLSKPRRSAQWSGERPIQKLLQKSDVWACSDSKRLAKNSSSSNTSATTAEQRTCASRWIKRANRTTGAVRSAMQQIAETLDSTILLRFARYATARSARTNTARGKPVRLLARACSSRGTVVGISVGEAHCYYAGGVLVSNCEAQEYALVGAGEGHKAIRPQLSNLLEKGRRQEFAETTW